MKAGGKFDPESSTGLAHYLEHMMFKGTSKFGTKDWATEKVLLDSIEQLYQTYRTITDPEARKKHYAIIDAVSNEASNFAIANEYDKMIQYIGGSGTNAYTSEDRTVYMNDIPANQLENWLQIEADRFSIIVNRLFHTELEAVYEEKNRSLDNDGWKVYENMYALLFPNHKYGTQTVIGTIEHLKNPSITDINAYFYKYYVPNNYAICLSGDLDPEKTIALVDKYFGGHASKEIEPYVPAIETPITSVREKTVLGPDAESLSMGFRFGGTASDDLPKVMLVDMLLNNSMAGLIDLNLVQAQKVLSAGSYVDQMNDFSVHTFQGKPREGQSLEEVRDLILGQVDLIKKGEFEDWLLTAIINDFEKNEMKGLENNYGRTNNMVMAFTNNMPWEKYISIIDRMRVLTKEDIMQFTKDNYNDNYAIVYKKTGEDPNKLQVEKPAITKVNLDRTTRSPFFENIVANEVPALEPMFLDYAKDVQQFDLKPGVQVLYTPNTENALFTLYYLLDMGTNENPKLQLAMDYLKYLGTKDLDPKEIKKEFYKMGCDINVSSSEERAYVYISGLQKNMAGAVELFEDLLQNPVGDDEVLANLKADAHKKRADNKKQKSKILWSGLMNYAKYGKDSPFTNTLSNEELNSLSSDDLLNIIKSIQQTEHKVLYYGPMAMSELKTLLNKSHRVPESLQPAPQRKQFAMLDTNDPQVFWTNYDMVQAEIVFQNRGNKYDKKLAPEVSMFNEYFGGMGGVAFQEIREAQGLAYSVFAGYSAGKKEDKNDVLMAYVGTQADKQKEAMDAMIHLLNNFPESEQTFANSKKAIMEKLESERVTKTDVLFNYLEAKDKGLDYDIRKDVYAKVKDMTFDDLKAFHNTYVKDKKYNIAVIGDRGKLNFAALDQYGKVQELSLEQLFGYKDHVSEQLN